MMLIAVVLAGGAVLVAARWINGQAASTAGTGKVAVALVDIALGSRLNPEMVRLVDWPANAMPPGAISDPKLLASRVTRASLQRGEPLMEGKLAPPGTQGGLSAVVAEGKRAMTVRVNDVVGVAGFALPGNFVDVLVNTQEDGPRNAGMKDASISKIVLERILVLAIAQEAGRDETKPKVVNAVTLELSPQQAERLDLARSVGTLSLVLRNQADPDPVRTDGATKASLLDAKLAVVLPAAAPARAAATARPRPQPAPREPSDMVEVMRGTAVSFERY
jgi:pilus assembly protein CpaB